MRDEGLNLKLTASYGIATLPEDAEDRDSLLLIADRAMFSSKGRSKDCIMVGRDLLRPRRSKGRQCCQSPGPGPGSPDHRSRGHLHPHSEAGCLFVKAVDLIYRAKGRVIVTGVGKSGIVARKLVATFNSTGTPALFLHPVEAMHGDLGMVSREDVVLALSNSGETKELTILLPSLERLEVPLIAFTGRPPSTLGRHSQVVIDTGVPREACPLGLAPTASTTAMLAMGDALAVVLLTKRGFKASDFRRFTPGAAWGSACPWPSPR